MARIPTLLLLLALPCGCASDPLSGGRPMTAEEIAYERALADYHAVPTDDAGRSRLLRELDNAMILWHSAQRETDLSVRAERSNNFQAVLQRQVYRNFPVILGFLRTGDEYQRTIAAAALGFSRLKAPADPEARRQFEARWPPLHKEAIPVLVDALDDSSTRVVQNAVLALGLIGDPDTPIPPLVRLLEHPEVEVRSNAALTLSRVLTPESSEQAIGALLVAMSDGEPTVRNHAISAVAACRHPNAIGSLARLLEDRYELVAMNAAAALAAIGDVRASGYLIARLHKILAETPDGALRKTTDLDLRRRNLTRTIIAALEQLSGKDYGDDIEEWQEWWSGQMS